MDLRLPKSNLSSLDVTHPPNKLSLRPKQDEPKTTITLDFDVFLDCLLTYKDWVCTTIELGNLVKEKDPTEQKIHVEQLEDSVKYCKVWRIRDWRESAKRRKILVDAQTKYQVESAELREKQEKLTKALSPMFDKNTLDTIIRMCIKNPELAKSQWGIEL